MSTGLRSPTGLKGAPALLTDPLGLTWTKEQTGEGEGMVVGHPRVLLWPGCSLCKWRLASEPVSHLKDEAGVCPEGGVLSRLISTGVAMCSVSL